MRRGGRILILLGILLGMLAAGGTFIVLSTQQAPPPQIQTRSIVIAAQTIPARTEIPAAALTKAEYPEPVPAGAFERIEDVSGKLAIAPIVPGQIILPQMIIDKARAGGSRSNASFLIPEGKVAVAFPSNAIASVAGAVQPGDYVDLMLTLAPGGLAATTGRTTTGTESLPVTQLMLQDVLILQIGLWNPAGGGGGQGAAAGDMITFVLTRQDALALKSAREQGSIELALRRSGDHAIATTEPVNLEYLNRRFQFRLGGR